MKQQKRIKKIEAYFLGPKTRLGKKKIKPNLKALEKRIGFFK